MNNGSSPSTPRLACLDNLRIYLTVLVVLHHITIGYGGSGDWYYTEAATDPVSPIVLALFNAINQSYFMTLFFVLAGYFVPRSYDRKGPGAFLRDRLIRLGIPLLLYLLVVNLLIEFVALRLGYGRPLSLAGFIGERYGRFELGVGPLWFVELLLWFCIAYAAGRVLLERWRGASPDRSAPRTAPTLRQLLLVVANLAFLTFLVRLVYPIDTWVYHFQPAHLIHYLFGFWLGIAACRGRWLEQLPAGAGGRWGLAVLLVVVALPALIILGGVLERGPGPLLGGWGWPAFGYSVWDTLSLTSFGMALLYLFRWRFARQGPLLRALTSNVYGVYIVHALVIVVLMAMLAGVAWPSALKAAVVALAGIPLCFAVSHYLLRRLPGGRRVLG